MTLSSPNRKRLERAIRVARDYQRIYARRTESPGTARDIQVLLVLAELGQASASEVARRLGRDRAAITRALERVRDQKLVRPVESKGRRQPHELTAKGERAVGSFLDQMD
jgi:DNA-binding MarR family transcriptional regulator